MEINKIGSGRGKDLSRQKDIGMGVVTFRETLLHEIITVGSLNMIVFVVKMNLDI